MNLESISLVLAPLLLIGAAYIVVRLIHDKDFVRNTFVIGPWDSREGRLRWLALIVPAAILVYIYYLLVKDDIAETGNPTYFIIRFVLCMATVTAILIYINKRRQ